MSNERAQLQWKSEGLPGDSLSLENALVILESAQPFLIDPTCRAIEWIRRHLKTDAAGARLEVVEQQAANFQTQLELALRFGKTLLIQEMNSIQPILYPLLRGDFVAQGAQSYFSQFVVVSF